MHLILKQYTRIAYFVLSGYVQYCKQYNKPGIAQKPTGMINEST